MASSKTGAAIVEQEKTFLFVKAPKETDFTDVIFSSEPLELRDFNQNSPDCRFTDHKEIDKGIHEVTWEPIDSEIKIGKTYKHYTNICFPFAETPTFKCMTIPFAAYTLKFQLKTESELPFEKVVVFKGSRYFRIKKAVNVAKRGKKIRRTKAPLPKIIDDKTFSWEAENIKEGAIYFVVLYLKDTFSTSN